MGGGKASSSGVGKGADFLGAGLVVARSTVQACLSRHPDTLTFIASADHPEDHACARYMEAVINGESPDIDRLLRPLRESDRYSHLMSGAWPEIGRASCRERV